MRPSGGRGSWRRSEARPKCLGSSLLKDCGDASSRAEEVKIDRKSSSVLQKNAYGDSLFDSTRRAIHQSSRGANRSIICLRLSEPHPVA